MEGAIRNLAKFHSLTHATDVVIGGCSAGGISTLATIDWLKMLIHEEAPQALVAGFSCSGFFLDYNFESSHYASKKMYVFHQQNVSRTMNPECIKAYAPEML